MPCRSIVSHVGAGTRATIEASLSGRKRVLADIGATPQPKNYPNKAHALEGMPFSFESHSYRPVSMGLFIGFKHTLSSRTQFLGQVYRAKRTIFFLELSFWVMYIELSVPFFSNSVFGGDIYIYISS